MLKQEKNLERLELEAREALSRWLDKVMGWNSALKADVDSRSEITKQGTWKATAMGNIDLATVSQNPEMAGKIDTLLQRSVIASILEYFADKNDRFILMLPDSTDESDIQSEILIHYQDEYGAQEWNRAVNLARSAKEPPVKCYATFSLEYYPQELARKGICGPNGQTLKMGTGFVFDSPFLYEKDQSGYQPLSIWIKDFVRGKAGDKSRSYVEKHNMLFNSAGDKNDKH